MTLRSRAVDAVFTALEGIAALYDFVRRYRVSRSYKPDANSALPFTSVRHQQEQIRRATTPPGRRDEMRPPRP